MRVKDIRKTTGLAQRDFAALYRIPLQTLKQWESNPGSTSYREPPDYLPYLLGRLVAHDYLTGAAEPDSRVRGLVAAARESRHNARHWLRYLRKELPGKRPALTPRQIRDVVDSGELTAYQQVSMKRALTDGTPTNRYVRQLDQPARAANLQAVLRKGGPNAS